MIWNPRGWQHPLCDYPNPYFRLASGVVTFCFTSNLIKKAFLLIQLWPQFTRLLLFNSMSRYAPYSNLLCSLPDITACSNLIEFPLKRLNFLQPFRSAENFANAAKFIRDAAAQRCHLAVLPEFHLTNWVPDDPRFAPLCADWERYLRAYQSLARECNICIVPGSIVQTIPGTSCPPHTLKLENVTYFISNTGEILGSYTKKNLWGPTERKHLRSSGDSPHQVIHTPLGPVGLLVCWDLAFPEAWRELVYQGAKIIILPTLWTRSGASDAGHHWNPSAESLFLDSVMTARAYENTCAVVFANAGGPPGRNYCGNSQVTTPYAGPLVRLGTSVEGMAIADLNMQVLEDAEANYSLRADLTHENWHYRHTRRDDPVLSKGKL